jgi:hypothetical protein
VLEYDGTPKAAYAEVQKWYSPVIAVGEWKGGNLHLTLLSDLADKTTLNVEVILNNTKHVRPITIEDRLELTIPAAGAKSYNVRLMDGEKVVFEDRVSQE